MMPQITPHPETLPNDAKVPTYEELLAENAKLRELVHQMREEIQTLRDEIARLKKQKPKPKIGPSKLMGKKRSAVKSASAKRHRLSKSMRKR